MTIVAVVCSIVLVVLLGFFGLAIWARRGEGRADPPGVRTTVAFKGGEHYTTSTEREAEKNEGSYALGEGVLTAIVGELEKRGLVVEPPDRDDYGWGVSVRLGAEKAYLLLGASVEADADWLLTVLDPSSGGPGPRRLLPHVDAAVRALQGVSGISWHRRERYLAGDFTSGSTSPLG